jgi:hypothetical protein
MKSILENFYRRLAERGSPEKSSVLNKILETYHYDKKIRLGANQDGGYVIGDIGNYDCYISCGISDEESFSRDFIEKYKMTKKNCFAFDGTILDYPWSFTKKITFVKKNINAFNDDKNTNLSLLTQKYKNIFLKMDIEGGEYPWLLSSETTLKCFKQIVIEFHRINDDVGHAFNDKLKCLQKVTNTHYLIHAHGNNCCPAIKGIPNVIELTFLNKDCFQTIPKLNMISFPIKGLDYPNIPTIQDIPLAYPFVSKNV